MLRTKAHHQRLFLRLPQSGLAAGVPTTMVGAGSSIAMAVSPALVAQVCAVNRGLPTYTHPAPPAGPVTELRRVQNPLNEHVPMPDGIHDMQQWGQVAVTMNKFGGQTFEKLLDRCRMQEHEVCKYCGWIIATYPKSISTAPKTQAPDSAAYLLRSGWDPDQSAHSLSYTRTYR